jgi:membrane fusion protein (multidrug efflux system)
VVGKLELSPGMLVTAGTVLATVTAEAGLEARLGLEAADAAQVVAGQAVTLVSANRPAAGPVTSMVRVAGGALDPVTGAAEVRVPVPAGAALLLGEHLKARIALKKTEALVAPHSAVLPEDGKLVLYTVKNGQAVRHEVTTGIIAGDLVEVSSPDLHDGDSVVTLGNYELTDGMAVQSKATEAKEQRTQPAGQGKETKP